MNINDFEIKIKKYDEKRQVVFVNVIICGELETRGWVVRYTKTIYSVDNPVWIANPPSVRGRNKKIFWIVYLKNSTLWQLLQKKITDKAIEYTNLL